MSNGTYILIRVVGGSSSGTPTLNGVVAGNGIVSGKVALIQRNVGTGDIELTVQDALASTTTITRNVSTTNITTYGDTLQFDASVSGAGPTPTGTVELRNGGQVGTLIGSGALSGGSVTITPADNALAIGTHNNIVAFYLGDATYSSSVSSALSPDQVVSNKTLTVSGAAADNKYYDATTDATLTGTLVGIESGDTVTLIGIGAFDNAGPGTAINVTSASALGGASAGNYTLTQPTGLSANIYASAIWINVLGGTWSTAANWTNNLAAAGTNVTANFSQLDFTADIQITNDTARTIGSLIFGDTDTSSAASFVMTNNTITLAGTTPTITVNALGSGALVTMRSILAGTSGVTKSGAGTLAQFGANTYTGGTTISNGTLRFNADAALGVASSANNITLNGGTLAQAASSLTLSSARSMMIGASGGTIANPVGGILTYNGIIGGPGLLTLDVTQGGGTGITIAAQNTNTGGVIFTGNPASFVFMSASSIGDPGSLVSGPFGTGTVTFNGPGTRSTTAADTTVGNAIIFAADATFATIASEKSLTLTGPVTISNSTRILTVNIGATVPGKSLTLNGVVDDGGNGHGLTKSGTGMLTLTRSNTYSGTTTITGGSIVVQTNGALGTVSAPTTVNTSASLGLAAMDYTAAEALTIGGTGMPIANHFFSGSAVQRGALQSVTGNSTWAGNVTFTTNDTRIGVQDGANLTISGNITDGGSNTTRLIFRHGSTTAGNITLSGIGNSWAGGTDIIGSAGAVILGADNALGSGLLRLGTTGLGGSLDLAGYDQTSAGLSQVLDVTTGVVKNDGAQPSLLTLNPSANQNFRGVIQDGTSPVALTINGAATQTLSGVNTYSGATTISGGTLALGSVGSIANTPSIAVGSGARFDVSGRTGGFTLGAAQTLSGNGNVTGSVTNNGTIAAGASIGTLTLGSAPVLNGTIIAELNQTNAQTADLLALTNGNWTYTGTLTLTNIGPALSSGTFTLFNASAGTYGGAFATLNLPPGGLNHWKTNNLVVDGTITFTNATPVAQDITAGVVQGGTVTLPVIGGKNSATDADSDTLSVTAVSTPGSGSASFGASNVTYVASGSLGTNTFTYTVSDGIGGTDTKTVTVVVGNPQGFNQVSAGVDGGNAVLQYLGIPGTNYALEITHSLPATNWVPVVTNPASASGYLYFTNPISLSPTNDYYRTRYAP